MAQQASLALSLHATKFRVCIGIAMSAAILMVAGVLTEDTRIDFAANVAMLAALLGLLWLGYRVTCPGCRLRLLFHAMTTHRADRWLNNALGDSACPRCGFQVDKGVVSSNTSLERTREG